MRTEHFRDTSGWHQNYFGVWTTNGNQPAIKAGWNDPKYFADYQEFPMIEAKIPETREEAIELGETQFYPDGSIHHV